jgi:hypothetical protein
MLDPERHLGRVADGMQSRCRVPAVRRPGQHGTERTQVADCFRASTRHDLEHADMPGGAPRSRAAPGFGVPCRPSRGPGGSPQPGRRCLAGWSRPKSCVASNGSGRASRRSRNTMRVKPYAMRSPSLTARHTALWAPGGCMSTSGCSCRYRLSLRTWSGGPGGISCTGQYRYRVSSQHKSFPKSHATRLTPSPTVAIGVPSAVTDGQVRKTNPTPPPHVEPLPSSTGTGLCASAITGLLATGRVPIRCSGTYGRGPTRPHAELRALPVGAFMHSRA